MTDRGEIARIVARESAETIVGRATGRRVSAVQRLLRPAAQLVAGRFVAYDRALGDRGTHRGAQHIVERATGGLVISGAHHVPPSGPVLVVANHPGLCDAVSLLASMRRDDAWIVTADYPFLRAMRAASRRFLFVDDRCTALRHIVRKLRAGDAVLLFPAGTLEPDPALGGAAARESLATWSRSIEIIARLVPRACIVPAVVSGAVSRGAFEHPLAKRRSSARERQRLASLLQLALPAFQRRTFRSPSARLSRRRPQECISWWWPR
ncbi:MAG TPA: 1-acyl-sn-glycerol-3-phosphate acyltransferase [Candidatus Limnocylindrales bacterium]|nr:1-acyl-sn-glycerol-3-phosphate acyltransferase [Candidatus Limnocylindrales bacterium]